jgi:hypothetical protein
MKTNKIRLFATMVTLAAVTITTTIPATAQRRQSKDQRTETQGQGSNDKQRTSRTQAKTPTRKSASKSTIERNTPKKSATSSRRSLNTSGRSQQPEVSRESKASSGRNVSAPRHNTPQRQKAAGTTPQGTRSRTTASRQVEQSRGSSGAASSGRSDGNVSRRDRSITHSPGTVDRNSRENYERRTTGVNATTTRDIYRLDKNDKRYSPNENYRGSKKVWSENRRPGNMDYNRKDRNYYQNYDYRAYKHWDRRWERYRWNFYSWRDYYHGYNPYSYRYHRYYYHHPVYGHVIRKFVYSPDIFVYNHNRYYCYDGHFFRFFNGIGYVLVDMPFGVAFNALPYGYERVYVNGYLYFRVGNLFFEFTDLGFRLVHYPERYYAYDDGYTNEGYYF